MLILALECSTSRGSAALFSPEAATVLLDRSFPAGRGQGGRMFTVLEEMMQVVRESAVPVGEILVGLGPGSYAGVRQAIAAATGLAVATGATLLGAPSTLALVDDVSAFHAVGDARRGSFYYTAVANGRCVRGPELVASAAALSARIADNPAWPVYAVESSLPDDVLKSAPVVFPQASHLLTLPADTHVAPPLEPIYLRPVSITLPRVAEGIFP